MLPRAAVMRRRTRPRSNPEEKGKFEMQDTQNNHRLQGHLLGAFSVLVWGTTFVATKVLLRTFSPIEIMIARFALGFLALLIVGRGLMRPQKNGMKRCSRRPD